MQYAMIPQRNEHLISWIYEIPVGSWKVRRMEIGSGIGDYIGFEGQIFNQKQIQEVIALNGQIFENWECFDEWIRANGILIPGSE